MGWNIFLRDASGAARVRANVGADDRGSAISGEAEAEAGGGASCDGYTRGEMGGEWGRYYSVVWEGGIDKRGMV